MECYDCHAAVQDLKQHRAVCPNSRVTRSSLASSTNVNVGGHGGAGGVPAAVLGGSFTVGVLPQSGGGGALVANSTDWYAIIDVSGSMQGERLDKAKKAVLEDIVPKMKDEDRMALVTFDTKAYFKLKPRAVGQLRRQNEIGDIVERIFAGGGTAIWDAICMAIEQLRDKTRRTIMTVLTDGEDNASTHMYADVLALLDKNPNVCLSIVHVGTESNASYVETARRGRGVYRLIDETQVRTEFTATFQLAYANGESVSVTVPVPSGDAAVLTVSTTATTVGAN